jgi:O-succinylbenzoic acid--CoA ligase
VVEFEGPHEFRFIGRYDNVINSGGIKLHPEKIEKKLEELLAHPYYIHSKPDDVLGQRLVLVIESQPYNETTLTLLKSSLKDVLDKYEVPKEIEFRPVFERTANGKIVRR